MLKTALKTGLITTAIIALAAPAAFAKSAKKDAEATADGPSAPIPYDQLAAEDAKLNGKGGGAKHHAAKKAAKDAAKAGSADAGAAAK